MQFKNSMIFLAGVFAGIAQAQDTTLSLMNNRFFTFTSVIRVYQVEHTRTEFNGTDESAMHTPELVQGMRDAFRAGWPGGRMTWAFSWRALFDTRANYTQIRALVKQFHDQYGDEVTFIDGGYFPNVYNSREQINRDMRDALARIAEFMGNGYRPASIVTGMLPAECQKFLADSLGIHVVQGQIWSQYAIDNGDDDGAISYPYYTSQEHMLKPARTASDFIDIVNLDGWTCDFVIARGQGFAIGNSRMGVGPIETIDAFGQATGIKEMLATTAAHFDTGFALNKFAFVTNIWEAVLMYGSSKITNSALTAELDSVRARWPTAKFVTEGEFGLAWRRQFKDNGEIDLRFRARGSGIGGSDSNLVINWYMNRDFRLASLRGVQQSDSDAKIVDYTRYDTLAEEPDIIGSRSWSLMNVLNMKQTRPQDKPISFSRLPESERRKILARYPELISLMKTHPDLASEGTASASSTLEQNAWALTKINNGVTIPEDAGWSSAGYQDNADHTEWIKIDLGSSVAVNKVVLYPRADVGNEGKSFPVDFTIDISTDGADWETVVTRTGYQNPGAAPQDFNFGGIPARFVRVQATKLGANDAWFQFQLNEFEVYATPTVKTVNAPSISIPQDVIKVRVEGEYVLMDYAFPPDQRMLAMQIFATSGRCVWSQAVTNPSGSLRWDRSMAGRYGKAAPGVYMVRARTDRAGYIRSFVVK